MRKLIVTQFISLDGVIEAPAWTAPYWNDEIAQFKGDETGPNTALLLGRVTYQGFSAAWPNSPDEGAPYFNNVRKYVASNTLTSADWNNSVLIQGDTIAEIASLKQQDGEDLVVHGSASLAQSLLENHLVDRLRLLVYPVIVGSGKRLFKDGMAATLKLLETKSFGSGVVALIYEPEKK